MSWLFDRSCWNLFHAIENRLPAWWVYIYEDTILSTCWCFIIKWAILALACALDARSVSRWSRGCSWFVFHGQRSIEYYVARWQCKTRHRRCCLLVSFPATNCSMLPHEHISFTAHIITLENVVHCQALLSFIGFQVQRSMGVFYTDARTET